MPLSKKRMRERKKQDRANVKPNDWFHKDAIFFGNTPFTVKPKLDNVKPELEPWEVTDWASYKGPIMPLPNCPDGRYR